MTLLTTWPTVTDDSGTKTDGTLFNKALTDAMKSAIETVVHSTTNPTVSAEDVIDEVVNARGSKANLDARLDVALNEDGTLKTQAGAATLADLQAATAARNVSKNSNLCGWAAGAAAAPDSHTLTGAGATIARTGAGEADTFTFGAGCYSLKITRAGADAKLTQQVIAAADMAAAAHYKGNKVGVLVYAKTSIASHARVVVDDGVGTTASNFHTGGGTEEKLTALHTISASATKLDVYVEVVTSNGAAYFSGTTIVFADQLPDDWKPQSNIDEASATVAGTWGLGTQTLPGDKTMTGTITFSPTPPIGVFNYVRNTADFTKNNDTALADVTGVNFSVLANKNYYFRFVMKVVSVAGAGIKFDLTGPAAPTGVIYGLYGANTVGAAGAAVAFSTAVRNTNAAVEELVVLEGFLRNGANAGTVQLRFAQDAAVVGASTVRAESFLIYMRQT